MAKQIVTLYIDDASLRLVVIDGKQIKEWAELSLEPGLVDNGVVNDEVGVAAKIKELFKAHKVNARNVSVGVSGLRCLSRPITLPQLPKEMLDEAVKREAKRVLPVPLEQLYMSWQTIPAPEGKTQVFIVAIPCKTVDALFETLRQAGLEPGFMDIKPLLLARLVKETTSVIVDVQKTECDIVIMTDGIPQPVRTLSFANEAASWEEKLITLAKELDRTIQFYNTNNPEKPLAENTPIFASGELANESEQRQSLSNQLSRPVSPLPSPMEYPEGFAISQYMVNLSLAFQKLSSGGQPGASVVNLNALPAQYRPKPVLLTNVFALPSAAVAAIVLVLLLVLMQIASADIASMGDQLKTAELQLQQKMLQRSVLTNNIINLQKKIAETGASQNNLTAELGVLEGQTMGITRALEVATVSLSSNTSASVSYTNSIVTASGRAPAGRVVISYFVKLDNSGRLGELTFQNMNIAAGGGSDFTIIGNLGKQVSGTSSTRVAVDNLPGDIIVNGVKFDKGTLTISGWSPDEDVVFSYARRLEATNRFHEVIIASIAQNAQEGMDFSIVINTGE